MDHTRRIFNETTIDIIVSLKLCELWFIHIILFTLSEYPMRYKYSHSHFKGKVTEAWRLSNVPTITLLVSA